MVHLINLLISVEAGMIVEIIRNWLDSSKRR